MAVLYHKGQCYLRKLVSSHVLNLQYRDGVLTLKDNFTINTINLISFLNVVLFRHVIQLPALTHWLIILRLERGRKLLTMS
jgi:hypothetical protein